MTHARLTPEIKEKAEAILKELGISISAAYEMFYRQIIAHQGIPFDLHVPQIRIRSRQCRTQETAREKDTTV